MAVNELASNTIRYAGGSGLARAWQADGDLVCEIEDGGRIEDPLVGRRRPDPEQTAGRGLWIANQVADLLEIRSTPTGTRARLHMRIPERTVSA
jgi:anti-sigma regulatory factor (Ser/Thr protein kinase)